MTQREQVDIGTQSIGTYLLLVTFQLNRLSEILYCLFEFCIKTYQIIAFSIIAFYSSFVLIWTYRFTYILYLL